jgi:hypothetical protein
MNYINIETLQAVSIYDIRSANPNMSIPDGAYLEELGYARIESSTPPDLGPWQTVTPSYPVKKDGIWFEGFNLITLSSEEIILYVTAAVQRRLDDFARTHNYDGILSACTYATSAIPKFALEGQYAVQARDETWATCYRIMGEVLQGIRPMPSLEAVINELPELKWPE